MMNREIDEVMDKARAKQMLILDLRGNSGGSDLPGKHLARYFARAPFHYWTWQFRRSPENSENHGSTEELFREPEKHMISAPPVIAPLHSRLIVLIDEGCYSATDVFIRFLKDVRPDAIFVGRPNGAESGWAQPLSTLRYSGFVVYGSVFIDHSPSGAPIDGNPIQPNYKILWSRKDIIEGNDPDLQMALKLARSASWQMEQESESPNNAMQPTR